MGRRRGVRGPFIWLLVLSSASAGCCGLPTSSEGPQLRVGDIRCDNGGLCSPGARFRRDAADLLPDLWEDTRAATNTHNAVILGVSLAAAIGIRQDLDDRVRENTRRHPDRWGAGSDVLGALGDPVYQLPAFAGLYTYSLTRPDEKVHDLSLTLFQAYVLTGLSNTLVKGIANTDRPDPDWAGGRWGFPSFHAASTFAIAGVLDEYYGPQVGWPSYALAGLVGWSRIDQRDHDLSDVVFGSALGLVIGKSVANHHLTGDGRIRLLPYVHPIDGTPGIGCDMTF